MAKRSLGAEWFGYDGDSFYPPKSFGKDDDPNWAMAYKALFYLVGGIDSSKNVESANIASITKTSSCFLEYILLRTIIAVADKISRRHRPTYQKQQKTLTKIKGRINFQKTATKCLGDPTRFVCEYHELNQNDPVSLLLKSGAKLIAQQVGKSLNEENRQILKVSVKTIEYALGSVSDDKNLQNYCFQFLSGRLRNEKFKDLYDEAMLIAYFVLYSQIGYLGSDSGKLKVDGVMLNLNRTFEKLLGDSLTSTGQFTKDKENLNEIFLVDSNVWKKSNFKMKPDCKGYLEVNGKTYYLLLDAKHKLMSGDLPDEDEFSTSLSEQINRADLYQMISYSETMRERIEPTEKTLLTLVGLNYENGAETDLINLVPSVVVDIESRKIEVLRISMNFGLTMKMLGPVLYDTKARNNMLKDIGSELIAAIGRVANLKTVS